MSNVNSFVPYSYRNDPTVPEFPDDKPLFIFDGVCVLCSTGARLLMRHDKKDTCRFMPAQSTTGLSIYKHYGIVMNDTYLLLDKGIVYRKSAGYLHICSLLGGWWRMFLVFRLIPRFVRDAIYDVVVRNRYKWFGTTGYCELIPENLKTKLLN